MKQGLSYQCSIVLVCIGTHDRENRGQQVTVFTHCRLADTAVVFQPTTKVVELTLGRIGLWEMRFVCKSSFNEEADEFPDKQSIDASFLRFPRSYEVPWANAVMIQKVVDETRGHATD